MSVVVIDISSDYVDDLMYSYQLVKEDDGSFSIWVETSVLRGYYAAKDVDSFMEAYNILSEVVEEREWALS